MTIQRRTLLSAVAAVGCQIALPAGAQQYPSKPIRLILPSSPGTTIDANGRFIADQLSKRLRTSVIVENRAGVGGGLGSDMVAKSPADGYTLLFAGTTHFTTRLQPDSALQYDPVKEFVAVAKVSSGSAALVVPSQSPYRTLGDVIQAMKARPGDIAYGTGGVGSTSHLCMVMLNQLTQTKANHVAYKGNAQAVTDTIGGQVAMTWQGAAGVVSFVKAGRLRALAVSGRTRWDSLPDVPTAQEAGVAGMEIASWMGVMGPAGLPTALVEMLSSELVRIANLPEYKVFADQQGMSVDIMDHRTFQAEMPKEQDKWKRLITLSSGS